VLQKSLSHGVDITGLREDLEASGLVIVAFDADDAEQAARLWSPGSGLSLADRACLALGLRHVVPVSTADWMCSRTALGATVHVRLPPSGAGFRLARPLALLLLPLDRGPAHRDAPI
jgi:PIN domain nuclease of toxin-antitoxin system